MSNSEAFKHQSYNPQFFAAIAAVDESHFWFWARNRVIAAAVNGIAARLPVDYRVLEIGCGTGRVLERLVEVCRGGEVVGLELYPEAAMVARKRAKCRVVVGDISTPPDIGQFDIIAMFDVLEHLHNDGEILRSLSRLFKQGGRLVLTVPCHMGLWSYFDVASCHCRRYAPAQLARLLRESGFDVEYSTEFMTTLLPLLWLFRRRNGRHVICQRERAIETASKEFKVIPLLNGILKFLLSWESLVVKKRGRLPFGTSLLVVARRTGSGQ